MNIREELKELRYAHKGIEERIDELEQQLEPEITEGQYWKRGNEIKRIESIDDSCSLPVSYHVITEINKAGGSCKRKFLTQDLPHTLLSDNEVGQALIKEAKRRGFVVGVKVKRPSIAPSIGANAIINKERSTKYVESCDRLEVGGVTVYMKGEWAEIIEDEWEAVYSHFHDNYIVGKAGRTIKGIESKQEAQAIVNALNNLDNE